MATNKGNRGAAGPAQSPAPAVVPDALTLDVAAEASSTEDARADQATKVVLRVVAKRDGFRRAGMAFHVEPTDLDPDTLSEEQLEALLNEPNLICKYC